MAEQGSRDPATLRSVLASVGGALDWLFERAKDHAILVTMCIKSTPQDRAVFVMYPASDLEHKQENRHEVNTNGQLPVYLGRYTYTVTHDPGWKPISNRVLDLYLDARPIISCELVPAASEADARICNQWDGNIEQECHP